MLSLEGVKFTTARGIAENVVNRVVASLGREPVPCRSSEIRIDRPEDSSDRPLEEQVERAVREEMAVRLSDVILRRTSLGVRLPPSPETVAAVARIAASDLGWTRAREEAEIADVSRRLQPFGSTVGPAG
jgi:glycerol-3-phosphate dehydrogenase